MRRPVEPPGPPDPSGPSGPSGPATAPDGPDRSAPPDAVVAVLGRAGRVLVIRRGPGVSYPGYWTLPGGRVEPGESQPGAVVREVHEELGLTVSPLAKVWECDTDDGEFRLHWWTVAVDGGTLVPDPGEVAEARWVSGAEFRRLTPTFVKDHPFFERVLPTLDLPRSA